MHITMRSMQVPDLVLGHDRYRYKYRGEGRNELLWVYFEEDYYAGLEKIGSQGGLPRCIYAHMD